MKHVVPFLNFVGEGAKLLPPEYDKVELTWEDGANEFEVLKTNARHEVTGFKKIGITSEGAYQVYYGLAIDSKRRQILSDQDPVLKKTMDLLKSGEIENGEEALFEFTKKTASVIRQKKQKIDYIVSLGSTKGLSSMLASVFAKHFPEAKILRLGKYEFENIIKAIRWDYVDKQGEKVLTRVKKDIIKEIDKDKTPNVDRVIQTISSAATQAELVNQFNESPDLRSIVWKTPKYTIRSSGLSYGGSRKWFKTKYATPKETGEPGDQEFVNAVIECMKKGKTMMYVDDNARTKEDLSNLFDLNDEIIKRYENSEKVPDHIIRSKYWNRFLAYVLIYVPVTNPKEIAVTKMISDTNLDQFTEPSVYVQNLENWKRSATK